MIDIRRYVGTVSRVDRYPILDSSAVVLQIHHGMLSARQRQMLADQSDDRNMLEQGPHVTAEQADAMARDERLVCEISLLWRSLVEHGVFTPGAQNIGIQVLDGGICIVRRTDVPETETTRRVDALVAAT